MEREIERQFVEDRATVLDVLPISWDVQCPGPYYCITMKMSRFKNLTFGFSFGSVNPSRDEFPVTDFPERVVKLDLSLNELQELKAKTLVPFKNLAELDVSLNIITSIYGLGELPNMTILNISFNALRHVEGFATCHHLTCLNLSHNQIRTIKDLPTLANLTQLHLNSNKLVSLDGIQNLPKLYELYIQNNVISSLLPISSLLRLNILDASNNNIISFEETLNVLRGLCYLTQLKLKGNHLVRHPRYTHAFRQYTAVQILDDCLLKDTSDLSSKHQQLIFHSLDHLPRGGYNKKGLKEAVRKGLAKELTIKKEDIESSIHYLHTKIVNLQEEMLDYEENMKGELNSCLRYIDAIPQEDFESIDPHKVPEAIKHHLFTKFWKRWENGKRKPGNVAFSHLTKPEEVVEAAARLLSHPPRDDF